MKLRFHSLTQKYSCLLSIPLTPSPQTHVNIYEGFLDVEILLGKIISPVPI
jgi:hypothetical protein